MKITIEEARDHLEQIMLNTDPKDTQDYLAGYIDCMSEIECITPEDRDILYTEYVEAAV